MHQPIAASRRNATLFAMGFAIVFAPVARIALQPVGHSIVLQCALGVVGLVLGYLVAGVVEMLIRTDMGRHAAEPGPPDEAGGVHRARGLLAMGAVALVVVVGIVAGEAWSTPEPPSQLEALGYPGSGCGAPD